MKPQLSELLSTIEILTSDAERECSEDMCHTLTVINSRSVAIGQFLEAIKGLIGLTQIEVERIRTMERSGAHLLQRVKEQRELLREELGRRSRHRSFAACVSGVFEPSPVSDQL